MQSEEKAKKKKENGGKNKNKYARSGFFS